jgi:hypothetical protein
LSLSSLRRAGHVERIDADHWRVPNDIVDSGMDYDLRPGGDGLRVRTLSTLDLEQQIRDLDRQIASYVGDHNGLMDLKHLQADLVRRHGRPPQE